MTLRTSVAFATHCAIGLLLLRIGLVCQLLTVALGQEVMLLTVGLGALLVLGGATRISAILAALTIALLQYRSGQNFLAIVPTLLLGAGLGLLGSGQLSLDGVLLGRRVIELTHDQ